MNEVIMIVKNDPDISRFISMSLESEGYKTIVVENGIEGLELAKTGKADMGIMGYELPGIDGYELTKEIRKTSNMPLVMLSKKDEDVNKIFSLNLGADDYMTIPFNPLELVARVNALFRRTKLYNKIENSLKIDDLILDISNYKLLKEGNEILLTATEFKILKLLMENPNRIYSKMQICEYLNGEFFETDTNRIAVHIFNIRDKIGENKNGNQYIKNVKGLGYKIIDEKLIYSA
ncbi:MAG TPA: response regulator transcription factor [Anaerovoracaceae bacterium]|nr:response regulator transcription factor [Anaerovoracaceae bacterium]